jgi:hypothetical protein
LCNPWQWWVISPNSRKLGFGGVPLEALHENHGVGGLLHLFLEQIHDGAAGVGCVWRRKFGVELFFGSGAAWSSPKHALSTGCYLFPGKRKEEGGPISVINSIFLCATNNIFVKYEG